MSDNAWRTVVIQAYASLCVSEGSLIITSENGKEKIPIEQIKEILVSSEKGSISFPLLMELVEQNTKIVLCNKKKNPLCEIIPYHANFESAGRIMDQARWTKRKKESVWRQIVIQKIKQQMELLCVLGLDVPCKLKEYYRNIGVNDRTNREAMASRIYFNELFGNDFHRHADDSINAGLNYGYTILCSAFNRAITMMGYNTSLGIHHCNRQNQFNLSCDLMEPFRPFVDKIVYDHRGTDLNWEYRQELISLIYTECKYNGKITDIGTAIEWFSRDIIKGMEIPYYQVGEIQFAEA